MKTILLHPTGNQFVRAALIALEKHGMLEEFHTTLASNSESFFIKYLPESIKIEWLRRSYPSPLDRTFTYPYRELVRLICQKLGLNYLIRQEYGWASVDSVYKSFDKEVSKRIRGLETNSNITSVYAYEDGALETFTAAKKNNLKCIYDLPIAYWETGRKLMMEESERLPHWSKTLAGGISDSSEKLVRKDQELELADTIVVPSEFVRNSLPKWTKEKRVISAPFGTPTITVVRDIDIELAKRQKQHRPLRVLFAGSMSQRKGLGDLFTAIRILNRSDIELVVMGSLLAPLEFYKSELPNFIYESGRSHEKVLELMGTCDVFCLPSIVEGRALVMQEAMSQGLPVIITPNTGGADLVKERETGFLVPIRSPETIAERLCWFLDNRVSIPQMSIAAKKHANTFTWENYGNKIIASVT